MSCCKNPLVYTDPCEAIAQGILTEKNAFSMYGLRPAEFILLVAQCDTSQSIDELAPILEDILACCNIAVGILQNIDENTDEIETLLADIITELQNNNAQLGDILIELQNAVALLTDIDGNTDDVESLLNTIISQMVSTTLRGTHTITTGTEAAAPAAGPYYSWVVVKTNAVGTVTVDGITLTNQGDATSEEAANQQKVPTPVIVAAGGATYEWRAKS